MILQQSMEMDKSMLVLIVICLLLPPVYFITAYFIKLFKDRRKP
ncbi:MAG TPA: hypothetical protein VGF79_13175 [Bacteroidia bacterium]